MIFSDSRSTYSQWLFALIGLTMLGIFFVNLHSSQLAAIKINEQLDRLRFTMRQAGQILQSALRQDTALRDLSLSQEPLKMQRAYLAAQSSTTAFQLGLTQLLNREGDEDQIKRLNNIGDINQQMVPLIKNAVGYAFAYQLEDAVELITGPLLGLSTHRINSIQRYVDWVEEQGLQANDDAMAEAQSAKFATYVSGVIGVISVALFGVLWGWQARQITRVIGENEEALKREAVLARLTTDLKRSNAELQQFAYVASHDLQEPLRAISGCLNILNARLKESLDEDTEGLFRHAVGGAKRLQRLIHDLLDLSRVETKGNAFELVNTTDIMDEVCQALEMQITESSATVTSITALPTVMADPSQLSSLLQNLISNAIKYTSPNRLPEIEISAKLVGDEYEFCIADNGIGVEEQYFDRIFVIFQRLHNRKEYSGTGVGLAVCKKIVERHGGKIWLESGLDMGCNFYFTLNPSETSHLAVPS